MGGCWIVRQPLGGRRSRAAVTILLWAPLACLALTSATSLPSTVAFLQAPSLSSPWATTTTTTLRPTAIKESHYLHSTGRRHSHISSSMAVNNENNNNSNNEKKKTCVVIGAGWGGLSCAYSLSQDDPTRRVIVVDAAARVGGLVRDSFASAKQRRKAEAGQHGFWDQYYNIFRLLRDDLGIIDTALTGYAEQGQYSPRGLEAIWPIYRDQRPVLPTGPAQALYTKFLNLPILDQASAVPLVLAFSEFDDSPEAWRKYDKVSFRDMCMRLGVSRRCYDEIFEPMILTGLFAPGADCSAAAALGMAYFFVLANQQAFDVRWCKGNIGDQIFDPWIERMQNADNPVQFQLSTRVSGFDVATTDGSNTRQPRISSIRCTKTAVDPNTSQKKETEVTFDDVDDVVFAVGASALNAFVRFCPELSQFGEFRRFANLRGTSVLATRLFLDKTVATPYTANACWGFDPPGVGMTFFNIRELHGSNFLDEDHTGSVIEVDYYHADELLVMTDDAITEKVKQDLDTMLGEDCAAARVVDAAVIRLPNAVNGYFVDTHKDMPDVKSSSLSNVYFAGDIVRTRHGSWSQEKAFVTGIEAANLIQGRAVDDGVIPLPDDEAHVAFGRQLVSSIQSVLGMGKKSRAPSLMDFLF